MAVTDERVSRGKLLKRAGIGAAAVGAGSMITAAGAGAFLKTSKSCVSAGGCYYNDCPDGPCCFCAVNTEGCCNCLQDVFCAGLQACSASTQCPPGWACLPNSGCGAAGVCAPHCGYSGGHVVPCGVGAAPAGKTVRPQ